MRVRFVWPALLGMLAGPSCADEDTPRDVTVEIGTASVSAQADPPDGLASLDLTVELDPTVDFEGGSITDVTLRRLPDGPELAFDVIVRGPQGTASIDLAAGDIAVARVTNGGTTNAELQPLCGAAASVTVVFEVESLVREASRDLTVTCS